MSSRSATPRLVRIHHRLRTFSFAMMFVATGLHIHDKDYGPLAWTLLALLFSPTRRSSIGGCDAPRIRSGLR